MRAHKHTCDHPDAPFLGSVQHHTHVATSLFLYWNAQGISFCNNARHTSHAQDRSLLPGVVVDVDCCEKVGGAGCFCFESGAEATESCFFEWQLTTFENSAGAAAAYNAETQLLEKVSGVRTA